MAIGLDFAMPLTASSSFFRSSIGKKIIVAITGIVLILFVIGHLLGNLQIFLGPDWINSYAEHLRELGPVSLDHSRLSLAQCAAAHRLHDQSRHRESPSPSASLQEEGKREGDLRFSLHGDEWPIVLAFIIYHIAHFTVRVTDPRFQLLKADPLNRYDVYSMMVLGFRTSTSPRFMSWRCSYSPFISAMVHPASFKHSD